MNGEAFGCEKEHGVGEYGGTKEVKNVVMTFEKCETDGFSCTSPGHSAGELVTNALEGSVVWENEEKGKIALDLHASGEGMFADFICSLFLGGEWKVRGSHPGAGAQSEHDGVDRSR